jgi:hypothetical protein
MPRISTFCVVAGSLLVRIVVVVVVAVQRGVRKRIWIIKEEVVSGKTDGLTSS